MECDRCRQSVDPGAMIAHPTGTICEDCFIDLKMPAMNKMMYENHPASFMLRLKDAYIACPQRYH